MTSSSANIDVAFGHRSSLSSSSCQTLENRALIAAGVTGVCDEGHDLLHVSPPLSERRHAAVAVDRRRTGVVIRQNERNIVMIGIEHPSVVSDGWVGLPWSDGAWSSKIGLSRFRLSRQHAWIALPVVAWCFARGVV